MRLQRNFPSRERFARSYVRRLSATEMEVELPRQQVLPAGTPIELDLRLEDGSPLLVGRGEVGASGAGTGGARRIRFVELDEASRAELPGLVALAESSARPTPDERDPDETLADLVAGVFGQQQRKAKTPGPDDTVFVPPEPPRKPRPAPPKEPPPAPPVARERPPVDERPPAVERRVVEESKPAAPPVPDRAPRVRAPVPPPATGEVKAPRRPPVPPAGKAQRRPSLLRRLQVSPAVIVASIIAGATGAAADAWFGDLAAFFSELTSDDVDYSAPPTVDLLPTGVSPSSFPEPEEAEDAAEPASTEPSDPAGTTVAVAAAPLPASDADVDPGLGTAAAAEEAPPQAADAPPADRVRVITWDESAAGTVVTFWGNGAFLPERIVRFRIDGDRPRELIKLRGIDLPFPETVLEARTPEVTQVRTGFHPQERINELHVVLDLPSPDVTIQRIETGPQSLRVHLHRADAPPETGE